MKRELGIGYCGLACALCSENENCIGCKKGGCPDKENCKNYCCCTQHGYLNCGACKQFPCQDSILHKARIAVFCKFVKDYGEECLLDRLEHNEKEGIVYHYENQMIGDYDLANENDIYSLLLNGLKVKN